MATPPWTRNSYDWVAWQQKVVGTRTVPVARGGATPSDTRHVKGRGLDSSLCCRGLEGASPALSTTRLISAAAPAALA